ncbi:hypothetical protein HBH42_123790 [Parastagonospora nodorum]|nr:hypothetical protein HBH42_123790 [Parastagonospora nodorum]
MPLYSQFSAVPGDDTRSSHEMLPMQNHNSIRRNTMKSPNSYKQEIPNSSKFREKWSPFPYRTFLTILLLPLALLPIVTLSSAAEIASQSYIRHLSCYPNGLWKFSPTATWEIMDSSYFFTPNLSFGNMTFTQVKVIDIAWDLVVGRGGQLGLAWVNYRVFNEWLVGWMEGQGVGWRMYAGVAFETTGLGALGIWGKEMLASGKGVERKRWWKRWLAMVSMFLSTFYVLSFPTLMAAMTGYIATSEPYLEDSEGNLIAFEKIDPVIYVVNDAARIGYEKPLVVGLKDVDMTEAVESYISAITSNDSIPSDSDPHIYPQFTTATKWSFNTTSISLDSPTLNITGYPALPVEENGISPASSSLYSTSGRQSTPYNATYLLAHGSCKPGENYQWGFSYIFLFMISIFNFIWACIMVGMWLETRHNSRLYRHGRRPGLLRSIVEFAAVLREEIGEQAGDMEDEELRKRLRESSAKLRVPEGEMRVRRVDTGDEGMRKRGWRRRLTRGSTF